MNTTPADDIRKVFNGVHIGNDFYFLGNKNGDEIFFSDASGEVEAIDYDFRSAGIYNVDELLTNGENLFFYSDYLEGNDMFFKAFWHYDIGTQSLHKIHQYGSDESFNYYTKFFNGGVAFGNWDVMLFFNETARSVDTIRTFSENLGRIFFRPIKVFRDELYFMVSIENRVELWKTNGPIGGTTILQRFDDCNAGDIMGVNPRGIYLYTRNYMNGSNVEVHFYDFSSSQTTLLLSEPDSRVGDEYYETFLNGDLFFTLVSANRKTRMMKSDGTINGTSVLAEEKGYVNIYFGGGSAGNKVFFYLDHDDYYAEDLWVSDGTPEGTHSFSDLKGQITEGSNRLPFSDSTMVAFFHQGNETNGFRPSFWVSNGDLNSTYKLGEVSPGATGWMQHKKWEADDKVYFVIDKGLWVSDGLKSTFLLDGLGDNDNFDFLLENGVDFIFNYAHPDFGMELWKTNGTVSGTSIIGDVFEGTKGSIETYYPWQSFSETSNKIFFEGVINDTTRGVFAYDGVAKSAWEIPKLRSFAKNVGSEQYSRGLLFALNDIVLVFRREAGGKTSLNVSSGSQESAELVKDFGSNFGDNSFRYFGKLGQNVFFGLTDKTTGSTDLWKTNGSQEGTAIVKRNVRVGSALAQSGKLYFSNIDGEDHQVWVTDGTVKGTELAFSLEGNSSVESLVESPNDGFFMVTRIANTYHTWVVREGDYSRKLIHYDAMFKHADIPDVDGRAVYVGVTQSIGETSVWLTDGTAERTWEVVDAKHDGFELTTFNDKFYFANSYNQNKILWRCNAEIGGLEKVMYNDKVINAPLDFIEVDDVLYFKGEVGGWAAIFRTDGTEEGTYPITDIGVYDVERLYTYFNGSIYFRANGLHGLELYRLELKSGEVIPANDKEQSMWAFRRTLAVKEGAEVREVKILTHSGQLIYSKKLNGNIRITIPDNINGLVIIHYQDQEGWKSFKHIVE